MAFDRTQPTNTTKIRNLGVVIRPNWVAIEAGDSTFKPQAMNFANRTVLALPVDPPAIADTIVLYAKSDASGKTQLCSIDPDSNVTQISNNFSPLSAQDGYTWLPGGMMMQWGRDHANAGIDTTINFPTPFSAAPYSITTNFVRTTGSTSMRPLDIVTGTPPTANDFTVWNQNGGHDFFWIAIGPKV